MNFLCVAFNPKSPNPRSAFVCELSLSLVLVFFRMTFSYMHRLDVSLYPHPYGEMALVGSLEVDPSSSVHK